MNYVIELLTTERKELKEVIEWVENPKSVREYKDDDEDDLKRWRGQVKDIENALEILRSVGKLKESE